MANAYVNFFSRLDPGGFGRAAQAFVGRASQAHRASAAVGANAAEATEIALTEATQYAEVRPTSGAVFACILEPEASEASEADRTAARIRIDEGERISLARDLDGDASLFLWAA